MSEIKEVQEQMKADMEAMLSMRRMMEIDLTHPSGINQTSHLAPDMVGQGGKCWAIQAVPIWCKVRILSHHTACHLTIHHPMQCTCPTRMPTTMFLFSLRASNPSWGMHPLLNLWEKPVKSPGIALWASLNHTLHTPLKDQHLVSCLSPMPREPLNIARYNPCIFQWGDYLWSWKKEKILIS